MLSAGTAAAVLVWSTTGAVGSALFLYPTTPDGRYFLVAGRLWRSTNRAIQDERRHRLVADLMDARRAVKEAKGWQRRNERRPHSCRCGQGRTRRAGARVVERRRA